MFPTKCLIPDTMRGYVLVIKLVVHWWCTVRKPDEMYFVTWDPYLIPPKIDPPVVRAELPVSQSSRLLSAAKVFANSHQSWTNWVKSALGYAWRSQRWQPGLFLLICSFGLTCFQTEGKLPVVHQRLQTSFTRSHLYRSNEKTLTLLKLPLPPRSQR